MSKVIESPVKRFKGTVTLRDPMDFVLGAEWDEAMGNIGFATKAINEKYHLPENIDEDTVLPREYIGERFRLIKKVLYPLLVKMVTEWNLTNILPGVTVENFPNASPGTSVASINALTAWLINECQKVYNGNEADSPNE